MCYIDCGEAKELHLSSDGAESVAVLNIKLALSCLSCWLQHGNHQNIYFLPSVLQTADTGMLR